MLSTVLRPAAGSLLAASVMWQVRDPLTALGPRHGRGRARRPGPPRGQDRPARGLHHPHGRAGQSRDQRRRGRAGGGDVRVHRGRPRARRHRARRRGLPRAAPAVTALRAPPSAPRDQGPLRRRHARRPRLRGDAARPVSGPRAVGVALGRAPRHAPALPGRGGRRRRLGDGGRLRQGRAASCAASAPRTSRCSRTACPQEVSYFREAAGAGEEQIPLSVVLVLDSSGSMKQNMHFLQEARHHLRPQARGRGLRPGRVLQRERQGQRRVHGRQRTASSSSSKGSQAWGGTSLYDAIHYGLGRIKDQPGRKAIVVFSDGADTTSSMKEQEVIDYAALGGGHGLLRRHQGRVRPAARSPRGFLRRDRAGDRRAVLLPGQGGGPDQDLRARSRRSCTTTTSSPTRRSARPTGPGARSRSGCDRKDAEVRVRKGYFAVKRRRPPAPSQPADGPASAAAPARGTPAKPV